MRNTKNTFDLSLDIPLYGNINKLNFCNEYELNHYCFAEGDADAEEGDLGAEFAAEAEFGDFGGVLAGDPGNPGDPAEFSGFSGGYYGGYDSGDEGGGWGPDDSFVGPPGTMDDAALANATMAAVLGDPEFDDEDDLGTTNAATAAAIAAMDAEAQAYNRGVAQEMGYTGPFPDMGQFVPALTPGVDTVLVNVTPPGDQFGYHGPGEYAILPADIAAYQGNFANMPAMETLAMHMAIPEPGKTPFDNTYQAAYNRATEAYDPGAPARGAEFMGFEIGPRGWAADQAGTPAGFDPGGFFTGLAGLLTGSPFVAPALDTLLGRGGTNWAGWGNLAETLTGWDANQTFANLSDAGQTAVDAALEALGYEPDEVPPAVAQAIANSLAATTISHVGKGPEGSFEGFKEGGLISLAEGGVPDDNRISYVRQNIDTSAGRPADNWFDRLDKNTQDYLKGAKGYDEWATVHGLETLDMDWDDFIEGGAAALDPMDWGEYGLSDQNPASDPLTGLVYGRGNVGDIRKYNIIDQLVSDVGVARPDMTWDQWGDLDSGLQGIGKPSIEYRKWLRNKTGFPAGLEESDFREEMSPIPSRNINYRVGSVNEQYNAQEGGGIRDLIESQMTLVDVLNTGQAIPPNMGTQQTQGSMNVAQPTAPNQQNVYTQSTQPQSFYAQPQQVKNYGNLY